MKPRILDLFCGAGGAAVGYHRAGFDVVGVDNRPQQNYPFSFVQADALEVLRALVENDRDEPIVVLDFEARGELKSGGSVREGLGFHSVDADHVFHASESDKPASGVKGFAAIHASPPCQAYSHGAVRFRNEGKEYPDLLAPTRDLLNETGLPWVIENVPGAPMRADFKICGCQVGHPELRRVRWFETSWHGFQMATPHSHDPNVPVMSVTGHGNPTWTRDRFVEVHGRTPKIADYRRAMGIDWMNRDELSQAIPPAYTEFIGSQLMAYLKGRVAA